MQHAPITTPITDKLASMTWIRWFRQLVDRVDEIKGTADAPAWETITGKPTEFPPETHTHPPASLALNDLTDVDTTGQATGDVLVLESDSIWRPGPPPAPVFRNLLDAYFLDVPGSAIYSPIDLVEAPGCVIALATNPTGGLVRKITAIDGGVATYTNYVTPMGEPPSGIVYSTSRGLYVSGNAGGSNYVYTTSDLVTWTTITPGVDFGGYNSGTYEYGGRLFFTGSYGIGYTDDLVAFVQSVYTSGHAMKGLVQLPSGRLVTCRATGSSTTYYFNYSDDNGATWTQGASLGITSAPYSLSYLPENNAVCAVFAAGRIVYSTDDAVTATVVTVSATRQYTCSAEAPGGSVIVTSRYTSGVADCYLIAKKGGFNFSANPSLHLSAESGRAWDLCIWSEVFDRLIMFGSSADLCMAAAGG